MSHEIPKNVLALRKVLHDRAAATRAPDGFVPVVGYEGLYSVSRSGLLFSHFSGKVMPVSIGASTGYPRVTLPRKNGGQLSSVLVHTLVARAFLGPRPDGYEVDHINRIRSDNRVENLRYVSCSTNIQNCAKRPAVGTSMYSKFKGVIFRHHRSGCAKPWAASIRVGGKQHYLKMHATEQEAAAAYDRAALALRGPGATTNASLGLLNA